MTVLYVILFIFAAFFMGGFFVAISVIVGAWIVFRTKNAQADIPFLRHGSKKGTGAPTSYVSELFADEIAEEETELSEAAQRIHEQKGDKATMMSVLKGSRA